MAIEQDPWIHPNLIGQPDELNPGYESKLIIIADRSIVVGLLGLLLPFLLYLYGSLIFSLPRGFIWPWIIPGAPLTILTGAIYGIVLARRVMRETKYKSLTYNRAFRGQVLNVLSLLLSAAILLMLILLLFLAVAISPSWK